ncbi:YigZ family protein [Peptostreptococcus equinus]|uniref:YigZ family protein n=1 Tax=Peptostreptococcus equinus TaxID=3003601 RepID=A0ABY7JRV6_9FIRM|nr:YigZ family protein [Peptostreptococcus sp. CBA3647]WAW15226.1 YigZ family protein [Peptostreptococcus sp. CBA3647]
MEKYRTVHETGHDTYIIEKSEFIGHAKPVSTEDEAKEFIDQIKSQYKDATHNVWAYVIGQNMNIQRYSDDGEPQGTAGIPTLEIIKKENLCDVVVVVTRYFGGVKLGAGGLVRAYTKGAKIGLEAAKMVDKELFVQVDINIDYTLLGKFQNELTNKDYYVKQIVYEENVKIIVYCQLARLDELSSLLTEISNGKAIIKQKDEFYLSVQDGKIID